MLRPSALALSLVTYAATATAAGPSCHDGIRNGPEADVDCGGDCPACELGASCKHGRDCISGLCAGGECTERPHDPGDPPPPGYELRSSGSDPGATAKRAGLVFFGVSYAGAYAAAVSYPAELAWMYVPVAGPWLALGNVEERELKAVVIVDGVFQAGGAILLVGGLASSGFSLVKTETASLQVLPRVGGLDFAGRF